MKKFINFWKLEKVNEVGNIILQHQIKKLNKAINKVIE